MRKPISGGQKKKTNGPKPELTEEQKQEIREAFDLFDSGRASSILKYTLIKNINL